MDAEEFQKKINQLPEKLKTAEENLAIVMGKTSVDFYKESFQNEGFTDTSLVKWQDVKRRTDGKAKGAAASRKILTGETGDLGESIRYEPAGFGAVKIISDKPYSAAQNDGTTTAGRKHNVTIVARPFIKESAELDRIIKEEIERKIDDIFK